MKKRMLFGWFAAALAAWTLHAAAEPPKLTAIEVTSTPKTNVTVRGQGEAGTAYQLKWSAKLGTSADWKHAGDATAKDDGTFAILDEGFRLPGFYRVQGGPSGHGGVQLWKDGPYWAETNIGADSPEDFGFYFWWGDTIGYKWENDAWAASDGSVTNYGFFSTNTPTYGLDDATLQSEGWTTAEGLLAPAHDAAQAHWGGTWRMPTHSDLSALLENCDWTSTTRNGVGGCLVRGRGDYADNSIFLPKAGLGYETSLSFSGVGYVWSSLPRAGGSLYAWSLYFDLGNHSVSKNNYRLYGFSVRPVRDPAE